MNRENNEGSGHEDGGGRHEGREAREGRGDRHEGREAREGRSERHEGREAREGRGERHEGRNAREGRGESHEGREGRGEHTRERGERGSKVESQWIPKLAKHVKTYKNGGRLTLQYNAATEAFVGNVVNTTDETLSDVRVEVHLSNGIELGPTKRTDLLPGATLNVELSAVDQSFNKWVTHPEAGIEEGHGTGGEEGEGGHEGEASERAGGHGEGAEGRGEHSEDGGDESLRPREQAFRPLFNQLQLLRGEMKAFSKDLKAKP